MAGRERASGRAGEARARLYLVVAELTVSVAVELSDCAGAGVWLRRKAERAAAHWLTGACVQMVSVIDDTSVFCFFSSSLVSAGSAAITSSSSIAATQTHA